MKMKQLALHFVLKEEVVLRSDATSYLHLLEISMICFSCVTLKEKKQKKKHSESSLVKKKNCNSLKGANTFGVNAVHDQETIGCRL